MFRVLVVMLGVVIILFILHQVLIPALNGERVFPMFRKIPKERSVQEQAKEDLRVARMRAVSRRIREKARAARSNSRNKP